MYVCMYVCVVLCLGVRRFAQGVVVLVFVWVHGVLREQGGGLIPPLGNRINVGERALWDADYELYLQHDHHNLSAKSLPRRSREHASRLNGQNRVGDMTHTQRGGLLMHHPSLAPSYHPPV